MELQSKFVFKAGINIEQLRQVKESKDIWRRGGNRGEWERPTISTGISLTLVSSMHYNCHYYSLCAHSES